MDIRMDTAKWACEYCTYLNWPSSNKCTLCRATKPPHLIADASNPQREIYKMAPPICSESSSSSGTTLNARNTEPVRKWVCHACTFLNWPRTMKCAQCLTVRRNSPTDIMQPLFVSVSDSGAARCSSRTNSPTSPERAKILHNDRNSRMLAAKTIKWTCQTCTYENFPKSLCCSLCRNPKPCIEGEIFSASRNTAKDNNKSHVSRNVDETSLGQVIDDNKTSKEVSVRRAGQTSTRLRGSCRAQSLSPRDKNDALGATAMPNNYREDRRLKQLKNKLWETECLWLSACIGVVEGDPSLVTAYLASGGSIARQV